jgi:hypothetical protein
MFFPTGRIVAIVERNLVSIPFSSLPQKVQQSWRGRTRVLWHLVT